MRHIVLIKSKNPEKFNYCKFGTYKNNKGKLIELIDPNGIAVNGYEMFNAVLSLDINDEDDKRVYEFLKDHPLISGKFSIDDLRANDEKTAEKAIQIADAVVVASGLNTKEYRDMARLIGISLDFDDHLLKAKIIQSASSNPKRFLDVYNDEDKDHRLFIKNAQDAGYIKFENGVWKHGSNSLGLTVDQVIAWFKDNLDIYALLKQDLRGGKKPAPQVEETKVEETVEEKQTISKESLSELLNEDD